MILVFMNSKMVIYMRDFGIMENEMEKESKKGNIQKEVIYKNNKKYQKKLFCLLLDNFYKFLYHI